MVFWALYLHIYSTLVSEINIDLLAPDNYHTALIVVPSLLLALSQHVPSLIRNYALDDDLICS
jgi:hypothetical protein